MGKNHAPPPRVGGKMVSALDRNEGVTQSSRTVDEDVESPLSSEAGEETDVGGVGTEQNIAMHFDVVAFDADDVDEASHLLVRCLPPGADTNAVGMALSQCHALLIQEGEIETSDSDNDASVVDGDADEPATIDYVGVCGVLPRDRIPPSVFNVWRMLKEPQNVALWVMEHTPSLPWHVTFPLAVAALQPWQKQDRGGPTHLFAVARALPVGSGIPTKRVRGKRRREEREVAAQIANDASITVTESDAVLYRGIKYVFEKAVDVVLFQCRLDNITVEVAPLGDVVDGSIRGIPIGVTFAVAWNSLPQVIESLQTVPDVRVES